MVRIRLFLALIVLGGCQLVGGYEEFDYATPSQEERHACDVLPGVKDDALELAVMTRVNMRGDDCFWMDRTEVTVEQYRRFESDVPSNDVDWVTPWCDWKSERTDPMGDPDDECVAQFFPFDTQPFAPKKPMRCVDFCEAEAFCQWAGKRLCYDTAGTGVQGPRGFPFEWRIACTNGLTTRYPWGNELISDCNTGQSESSCIDVTGTCGPVPVGLNDGCSTPSGIADLLGNVAEWIFSCNLVDSTEPAMPVGCLTRGGGYDEPLVACEAEATLLNDVRAPALGFRCCADLTTDEEVAVSSTRR